MGSSFGYSSPATGMGSFRLVAFVLHQHKGAQAHQWNEEQCEQSVQTAVAFIAGAIRLEELIQ